MSFPFLRLLSRASESATSGSQHGRYNVDSFFLGVRSIRTGESLIDMTSYYKHVEDLKAGKDESKLGFV